jgi:hypothetical protein
MANLIRIARKITATHDMDVVESVIDGGSFDKNVALDSISGIIEESGNEEAKSLLKEIIGKRRTAGAGDLLGRIKKVARGRLDVLMALLAAAVVAGSVDARAAEKAFDDAKKEYPVEHVQEQPFDQLEKGLRETASSSILRACGINGKYNDVGRRMKMLDHFLKEMEKNASGEKTLERVFKETMKSLSMNYERGELKIIKTAYEYYCWKNKVNAEVVKCFDGMQNSVAMK